MHKSKLLSMLVLAVFAFTAGCTAIKLSQATKIQKPVITYVDYQLGDPTPSKIPVYLNFIAHNPNDIGLKNVFVSYDLHAEGKQFLSGSEIELTLTPNGDTKIVVPAEVIYKDVFNALGPIAKRVLSGKETLPVLVNVKIFGNPTVYNEVEQGALFSFTFSTSQTVEVPIPQEEIERAKNKAIDELRKIF